MPDPLKDRILKAQLQKLQSFKENSTFLSTHPTPPHPPSYFTSFGFILFS